jgi:hypothetical protein
VKPCTPLEYGSRLCLGDERGHKKVATATVTITATVLIGAPRSHGREGLGGMGSPNASGVWRLITNSNVVGCSTGRSANVALLRILSKQVATRRSSIGHINNKYCLTLILVA